MARPRAGLELGRRRCAGGVAPGDRIAVALVGAGPHGQEVTRKCPVEEDARVVAVCDVKSDQLQVARELVDGHYQVPSHLRPRDRVRGSEGWVHVDRRLAWDPREERFVDDDGANRLLACRDMRAPWKL